VFELRGIALGGLLERRSLVRLPIKVKVASTDALHAFKLFATNPVGGLSSAFDSLGQDRALGVGITFGALLALCVLLGVYRLVPAWGRPQGFGGFVRILVVAVVPFVSLFGATILGRLGFRGHGSFGHDRSAAPRQRKQRS
jgi:hypothetical protein